ncbi:MAG: hypothetical protein H8E43_03745 [Planctomycetia bacterium]|nr:hypothetical protein [Planctomycetia bacterium]MBL6914656.1 hypothetical protein [Planctomycetota bacterium]
MKSPDKCPVPQLISTPLNSTTSKASGFLITSRWNVPVLFMLICIITAGCNMGTPQLKDSSDPLAVQSKPSRETYQKVLKNDELLGYVGEVQLTTKSGGTQTSSVIFKVYDTTFNFLGTYNELGRTHRFDKNSKTFLGNYEPEDSFRQIMEVDGMLRFEDGIE